MYDIWIGGDPEQPELGYWWEGYIDNVRLYNYALSATEIFFRERYHVDAKTGNDNNDGLKRQAAFKTIQRAVAAAEDGDMILVWPGVYNGPVDFQQKSITIKSAADAAVIEAQGRADARIIEAEAEAEALKVIAAAIRNNPDLLTYQYITKLAPNIDAMLLPNDSPFLFPLPEMTP